MTDSLDKTLNKKPDFRIPQKLISNIRTEEITNQKIHFIYTNINNLRVVIVIIIIDKMFQLTEIKRLVINTTNKVTATWQKKIHRLKKNRETLNIYCLNRRKDQESAIKFEKYFEENRGSLKKMR